MKLQIASPSKWNDNDTLPLIAHRFHFSTAPSSLCWSVHQLVIAFSLRYITSFSFIGSQAQALETPCILHVPGVCMFKARQGVYSKFWGKLCFVYLRYKPNPIKKCMAWDVYYSYVASENLIQPWKSDLSLQIKNFPYGTVLYFSILSRNPWIVFNNKLSSNSAFSVQCHDLSSVLQRDE